MSTSSAFDTILAQITSRPADANFSPDLLYELCLRAEPLYHHVEEAGDYYTVTVNGTLYLLLQWSHGLEDWKNNFDFPARPYRDMPTNWLAHRGFVRVWKAIEPYVKDEIANPDIRSIIVVGYSHGAALTALAHEYVWYNRPDIRETCFSFAFEPPRVFCGLRVPDTFVQRWKNLYLFRTANDLVTHVPPALFCFKHVGNLITISMPKDCPEWYHPKKCDLINAHYPANVRLALSRFPDSIPSTNPSDTWVPQTWDWAKAPSK